MGVYIESGNRTAREGAARFPVCVRGADGIHNPM